MKLREPIQQLGPYHHFISNYLPHCILLGLCFFIFACALKTQQFTLRSRTIYTRPGIEVDFKEKLKADLDEKKTPYVLVQLHRNLNVQERADLHAEGIKLLSYIGSYAWFAELTNKTALQFTAPSILKSESILSSVRWMGKIIPEDRVTPEVFAARKRKQDKTDDNRERYSVYFFKNISMETGRKIIKKYGGKINEESRLGRSIYSTFPPDTLDKLMAEETIKLIDLYPPPDTNDNDGSRAWTRTDAVHAAGRTGTGIPVGIWEAGGLPRDDHVDFTPARVHLEEAAAPHWHATHVAGTLVGTGAGIAARMGHAPGVGDLHCYTSSGAADEMVAEDAEIAYKVDKEGVEGLAKEGVEVYALPPEESQRWRDAAKTVEAKYISDTGELGAKIMAVLNKHMK